MISDTASLSGRNASEALQDLKKRLRAMKEDREHYLHLTSRATRAFDHHRRELTLLQQKERAVRTTAEDALRLELHGTLLDTQSLLQRAEEARLVREAALKDELRAARLDSGDRLESLQAELDVLRQDRRALEQDIWQVEHAHASDESELRRLLAAQEQLHEALQGMKETALSAASLEKTFSSPRRSTRRSTAGGDRGATAVSSPRRQQHRLLQSTATSPSRLFVPNGVPPEVPEGLGSCSRSAHRRRTTQPTSHHAFSMLSTIERRNYLRPRAHLQRCGRDVDYTASPFHLRLQEAQQQQVKKAVQSNHMDWINGGGGASATSLLNYGDQSAHSNCGNSSSKSQPLTSSVGVAPLQVLTAAAAAPVSLLQPPTCHGPHAAHAPPGNSINTACGTLLNELQELRMEYNWCREQLRAPGGDSVEASKDMRRLMSLMDRKSAQIAALRVEQSKNADRLRMHDVIRQVTRENRYCEQVYDKLVHLVRSP